MIPNSIAQKQRPLELDFSIFLMLPVSGICY